MEGSIKVMKYHGEYHPLGKGKSRELDVTSRQIRDKDRYCFKMNVAQVQLPIDDKAYMKMAPSGWRKSL